MYLMSADCAHNTRGLSSQDSSEKGVAAEASSVLLSVNPM
jgi:hypothetical protein